MFKNAKVISAGVNPVEYHNQKELRGTPEYFMSPSALRELDAWIAEHVMKLSAWKETPERITCILNPNEFVLSIPNKIVRARLGNNPTSNFQPTIDPTAAMQVIDKCIVELGYVVIGKFPSGLYGVSKPGYAFTEAPTIPRAICLFAQKLYGN